MKKALSLFVTLLALTGLRAQSPQAKKETAKPDRGKGRPGLQVPVQPSPEGRTVVHKQSTPLKNTAAAKIIKGDMQKPFKKTKLRQK